MFVTVTLITLICLGVNYILSNFWHRPFIKKINTLPGPTGYPLVGSTFYFLGIITNEIMQIVNTLVNDFSSPFRIWFGNTAYIGVYDGEHIKAVLQSRCFKKSSLYKVFKPALGTGLITSHVSLWSSNRKMVERIFSLNNLRIYCNIFVDQSLVLTGELEKVEQNGNEIILLDFLYRCNLNIACGKNK